MNVVPLIKETHEEHVCCNLDKLQNLEAKNKQLVECLREISDYINNLDTQDKRAINNIIINNL
jgi:hypothetical protein